MTDDFQHDKASACTTYTYSKLLSAWLMAFHVIKRPVSVRSSLYCALFQQQYNKCKPVYETPNVIVTNKSVSRQVR
jgi:hypothetical protein